MIPRRHDEALLALWGRGGGWGRLRKEQPASGDVLAQPAAGINCKLEAACAPCRCSFTLQMKKKTQKAGDFLAQTPTRITDCKQWQTPIMHLSLK